MNVVQQLLHGHQIPALMLVAILKVPILGDSGFFRHQGIVKATVSEVFEDLKFKISEGSDQN